MGIKILRSVALLNAIVLSVPIIILLAYQLLFLDFLDWEVLGGVITFAIVFFVISTIPNFLIVWIFVYKWGNTIYTKKRMFIFGGCLLVANICYTLIFSREVYTQGLLVILQTLPFFSLLGIGWFVYIKYYLKILTLPQSISWVYQYRKLDQIQYILRV